MRLFLSKLASTVWLLSTLASARYPRARSQTTTIPAAEAVGPSTVQFVAGPDGLDAPKVSPINATTYDWWYFDVVSSSNPGYSVVVVFFAAPASAFPNTGAPPNDITEAYLFVSTPDNPNFYSGPVPASGAHVTTNGNGASGTWDGTGFSFKGESDMSEYDISINSPQIAVTGSISIKSSAPAHYPCGPVKPGASMTLMPHVGWSNAIPDGDAKVKLNVNGTNIEFSGRGYHDKNWGDAPFPSVVGTWYWGHGRLGPYSVVWFDTTSPTGQEYVSAYVSANNQIITGNCVLGGTKVRPSNSSHPYPPSLADFDDAGKGNLHVEIDLGNQGTLAFDVIEKYITVDAYGYYIRWTGALAGGIKGGKQYTGVALYEQFDYQ